MNIREATLADCEGWLKLRIALWPDEVESLEPGILTMLRDPDEKCFLAFDGDEAIGFIEMSLRKYAEGCTTSPVAFVEGWFVREHSRKQRVGAELLRVGEDWGRSRGCSELGSDTEVWRTLSREIHSKLGFEEVEEIVAFRKSLI